MVLQVSNLCINKLLSWLEHVLYENRVPVYDRDYFHIKGIFDIPIYTSKEIQVVTSSTKGYDPLHTLPFRYNSAFN